MFRGDFSMKDSIDCLFVGYTGYDLNEIEQKFNHIQPNVKFENPFNGAIAYLGTYLNKNGISFDFINSFSDEAELLIDKLENLEIKVIAITTTFCRELKEIASIVKFIKQYNAKAKIVAGGVFITNLLSEIKPDNELLQLWLKRMNIDFYFDTYEGEFEFLQLINAIKQRASVEDIPNIFFLSNDEYKFTATMKVNSILQDNLVNYRLFDKRIGKIVYLKSAKSCPFSCAFCNYPIHSGKYQNLNISDIEKQLSEINTIGTVELIQFLDDTFNVPQSRFKDILRMMIKNKFRIKWFSFLRCQFLDRETVELMKESGCIGVLLGIESGNQQILNNMKKNVKVEDYKYGLALLNEYDIVSLSMFIIGFPGETVETLNDTINFIEDTQPTFFSLEKWYCDPHTPIYNEKEKYSIKGSHLNWKHITMDSVTADKYIDSIKNSIRNSVCCNLPYIFIIQLLNMGYSLTQVKEIISNLTRNIS